MKQWLSGALLCLVLGALAFGIWRLASADRRAFVEKLHIGYEKDIVLLPVYANLPDAIHYQALILKGIQPYAWEVSKLIWRVLRAGEPERADLASVTGSNWCNIVAYDEWQECCLGAKAWQKAVRHELRQPELSASACVNRLRTWPPALLRLTRSRIYRDDFLETVVRALQGDARRVREFLERESAADDEKLEAAAALYNAGACLHGLKETADWRKAAEEAIRAFLKKHQARDGTIDGDIQATVKTIESVMPPLAIADRAGLPPPTPALSNRLQKLLEFLVYTLDMYGCVPFAPPDRREDAREDKSNIRFFNTSGPGDTNQREWLFWGSRIFRRADFAWVAYGGFDMLEASPPPQTSKAFPNLGLYVMRNNWEISRFVRRGEQFRVFDPRTREFRATVREREFHNMSHALWFDARRGIIEIFAFGQRQVRLRLPWQGLTDCAWQPGKEEKILTAKAGKAKLAIAHLPDIDAWAVCLWEGDERTPQSLRTRLVNWAVRLWGGEERTPFTVEPLRTRLVRAEDQNFIVTDPGRPAVRSHTFLHLRMKKFGALCLKTDGMFSESGDGQFTVTPRTSGGPLTLALAGATGVWRELDGRYTPVTPAMATAGGDFAITADESVFYFHEHAEGKAEEKNRRQKRLKFDGGDVSIQTLVLEDDRVK